jgi:hypothetical protein
MRDIGITFHLRGRKSGKVTNNDAYDVGVMGIFYVQSLLSFLALLDGQKLEREATEALDFGIDFENVGELGVNLLSASLACFEQLEDARKEAVKQSDDVAILFDGDAEQKGLMHDDEPSNQA